MCCSLVLGSGVLFSQTERLCVTAEQQKRSASLTVDTLLTTACETFVTACPCWCCCCRCPQVD